MTTSAAITRLIYENFEGPAAGFSMASDPVHHSRPSGEGASQAEPEGSGIIAALLGSLLLSIQMQSQALKLKQKTKDIKTPNV